MKKEQREHDKEKYPSNRPWAMRISIEERERFKQAAKNDGYAMATWLKRLARARIKAQEVEQDI